MKNKKLLAIGTLAATATATLIAKSRKKGIKKDAALKNLAFSRNEPNRHAYIIGGGIGGLSTAVYLIQDAHFNPNNIHILEAMNITGGSNDGGGNSETGFITRGSRMLNEETYENFWELFRRIPSLEYPNRSVTDEILSFDHSHPTRAKARLIDRFGKIVKSHSMGFSLRDRFLFGKLLNASDEKLDGLSIADYFGTRSHLFQSNFWHMWQTTYSFQTHSSVLEFKHYIERKILEIPYLGTLESVTRTPYNQYESLILPLKTFLNDKGVDFKMNCVVLDLDFKNGDDIQVSGIHVSENGIEHDIELDLQDLCFMNNGSMSDNSSLGDRYHAPTLNYDNPPSFTLWKNIALKKPNLGNPKPFCEKVIETNWETFSVTMKGNKFLKLMEGFTNNIPGSGALMSFKDSAWKISMIVPAQPHFKNQPLDVTTFWGYALYTNKIGDYVKKPMKDCTGDEILNELIHHLHFEDKLDIIMSSVINVIPCMMPYIHAPLQPHMKNDRPLIVPKGSKNLAFVSQFVDLDDITFNEEFTIRAARSAVYELLKVDKKVIEPINHKNDPRNIMKVLKTFTH